ncbi:MAG: prolyl oligopeptidase family serine peptidase [Saprospiraceae bacterium]|nr:prolyl oligopeptidase family serine peptidase [Saprospiraceae bacterium]
MLEGQSVNYQTPDQSLVDLVEADPTPGVSLSPDRKQMLLMRVPPMPSIEQVSQKELRIGGLRINPMTNGGSRSRYYVGLTLAPVGEGAEREVVGLPEEAHLENVSWSIDGAHIACTHTTTDGLELWVVDVASAKAKRLGVFYLNDAMPGLPLAWFPDSKKLLIKQIPVGRGGAPVESVVPTGPVVQENQTGSAPVRTYQDLLKNPHDEDLFSYYSTSQAAVVDVASGATVPLLDPGINWGQSISPDGQYIMMTRIKKPFSYIVPYYRFAQEVAIFDLNGREVRRLGDIPAAENIPKGFNAVRTGPRSFGWRADRPAMAYWVEAQDGGDPKKESAVRDQLFLLDAPFTSEAQASITFSLRYAGIDWGDESLAIANEYWWSTRQEIVSAFNPSATEPEKEVLFDRSYEDRYTDPGSFQTTRNQYGRSVLLQTARGELYLTGMGASPEGNRPFVDRFNMETKTSERLWRSEAPTYEIPIGFLNEDAGTILTRREQREVQPNFHIRNLKTDELTQITHFPNPYESLKGIKKELIKYQREDGVDLTGTLYLPAGYDAERDGPLPTLMWAYPREFKSKDAASQVRNSPHEFLRLYYGSPIYWITRGYAIFDNFAMPIIGEGDEEPNETFTTQLVQGASAAIDKIVEMGVTDRNRIGVGGHSYGAFMTANLLAHSDLFAAGIARSGAYNRTLTPFGFQAEERTYWEAPDVYYTMSPFMHADKIKEPLLLIHGEADNNSGTYPMQSERFYAALKGHGSTVRLVMLPAESHGYRARESIMHMLWEQDTWLEKHVKNANKKRIKP